MLDQINPGVYKIIHDAVKDTENIPDIKKYISKNSLLLYHWGRFSKTPIQKSYHDASLVESGVCSVCGSKVCAKCSGVFVMDYFNNTRVICFNCAYFQIIPRYKLSPSKIKQDVSRSLQEVEELRMTITKLKEYAMCLLTRTFSNYFSVFGVIQLAQKHLNSNEANNELVDVFVDLMDSVNNYYQLLNEEDKDNIRLVENYVNILTGENISNIKKRVALLKEKHLGLQEKHTDKHFDLIKAFESLNQEIEDFNKVRKERLLKKGESLTLLRSKAFILKEKTITYNKLADQFDEDFEINFEEPTKLNNVTKMYLICHELSNIKVQLKEIVYTLYAILYKQLDVYCYPKSEILRNLKKILDQHSPEDVLVHQAKSIQSNHSPDENMRLPKNMIVERLILKKKDVRKNRIKIITDKSKYADQNVDRSLTKKKPKEEGTFVSDSLLKSNRDERKNEIVIVGKPPKDVHGAFLKESIEIHSPDSDSFSSLNRSTTGVNFGHDKKTEDDVVVKKDIGNGIPESLSRIKVDIPPIKLKTDVQIPINTHMSFLNPKQLPRICKRILKACISCMKSVSICIRDNEPTKNKKLTPDSRAPRKYNSQSLAHLPDAHEKEVNIFVGRHSLPGKYLQPMKPFEHPKTKEMLTGQSFKELPYLQDFDSQNLIVSMIEYILQERKRLSVFYDTLSSKLYVTENDTIQTISLKTKLQFIENGIGNTFELESYVLNEFGIKANRWSTAPNNMVSNIGIPSNKLYKFKPRNFVANSISIPVIENDYTLEQFENQIKFKRNDIKDHKLHIKVLKVLIDKLKAKQEKFYKEECLVNSSVDYLDRIVSLIYEMVLVYDELKSDNIEMNGYINRKEEYKNTRNCCEDKVRITVKRIESNKDIIPEKK